MRQSEVKELSVEELYEELTNNKTKLSDLKMTHVLSPLENPSEIKKVRRSIARIATEITKRELD
ncbi:LSU ribosomal protein L29p (L35e) RpmC [Psychroflexus torquis ATCC 700755]|jgi:large subunit ribosomal protein L29|uniref:Large ribosomal subunit protein uL29 n=1 Tax=Psychroflexus torquis (strain ATCC 700755 / CIP 106069 / ACAM 623) TaxID=313595 RepID=K4IRA9_PSYTT|nr:MULTISPECIES: 50S ribosomal protein L29 [Psychroflexus]AFU67980.1 LSU ribosomal protein L29p (L35e) RpmC [Psychroflexus torquis ATCC 700755]PKG42196.1 50S ribosomal protein L29 [Psychroflexus sp. MES1-P1E]